MATTTSFGSSPSQITALDGSVTRSTSLTVPSYLDLEVPTSATVNGIVITWTGGYSSGINADAEVMTVAYAGSSNSSILSANSTPATYSEISTVTYGSSTQLWGITWAPAQANAITTKMFTTEGTFYHDSFQVTIHYTEPISNNPYMKLSSGRIQLVSGKISL